MNYTVEKLIIQYNKGIKYNYLFFWGHQADKDGIITKSSLSQWWPCGFKVEGENFSSAEQYMMLEKAKLFKDFRVAEKIRDSNNPKEIKALGREIKNFDETVWEKYRYEIVKKGNEAKFSQNKELLEFLIKTKDCILVEASPFDKIWGIGLSENEKDIQNPLNWKGKNLLGFALMEVRDQVI